MKILKVLSNQYFWLGIILILATWVRIYKIDSPIADWHSWRQADTAAVTRNFIKEGFNPFFPKGDDMSGIADIPMVNSLRLRFVEFPVYNIAVYPFYLIFGVNEVYSRLVSILFSLGSLIFIYLIARKCLGRFSALLSAFCFGLLPFNVFFSRTTLPEPTFIFFALGMVYFLDKFSSLGFIFMAVAFLIKPWAFFFYLPIIYSALKKGKHFFFKKFIPLSLIALLPFVLWRLWILQQPESIPAAGWLMNGDGIRFKPAFWRWILSERLGGEILGVTGLFLFLIGFITRPKNGYFLHIWALAIFLYFAIFATGNVRHDYYQVLFVPVASIFLAKGFVDLFKGGLNYVSRIWMILLALLFLPLTFYLTWDRNKEFYNINNPSIVEAGKMADKILPKNAIVLAPYNGDSAFLYQTNRAGFAFIPSGALVKDYIADYGVSAWVSTSLDNRTNWVMRHFQLLEQNPKFVIVDLTHSINNLDDTLDPEPKE